MSGKSSGERGPSGTRNIHGSISRGKFVKNWSDQKITPSKYSPYFLDKSKQQKLAIQILVSFASANN